MSITLHDEIVAILRKAIYSMTSTDIASAVNRRQRYHRKDGKPIPASQIRARVNNYTKLFLLNGSIIELRSKLSVQKTELEVAIKLSNKKSPNSRGTLDLNEHIITVTDVKEAGFSKLGIMSDLLASKLLVLDILTKCGVYVVTIPKNYTPEFISLKETKQIGNVINPYNESRLSKKWVDGVDVIYIGLAGRFQPRSLRKRLLDLLRHGRGQTTKSGPHKGGEILWQLKNYETFTVWIMPTDDPPTPRDTETHFITKFEIQAGQLPFANRQH